MKNFYKIVFSIITSFVLCLGLSLPILNSSITASAKTISSDSIVDTSNTNFYRNYDLLEYVTNNGDVNSYIDTGYYPTGYTSIKVRYMLKNSSNPYRALYGVRTQSGSNYSNHFTYYDYTNDNTIYNKRLRVGNINSTINTSNSSNLNTISYLQVNPTSASLSFNDSTYSLGYALQSFTSSYSLYLFALNNNNSVSPDYGNFNIYSFKIYNGSTLVRDFVPAMRKSDSAVGLYDLANNSFYTSNGSSSLRPGPTVYTVNFYNDGTLYNTQSFTSFNDFVLPSDPTVASGYTFVGWSLTDNNDINSIVNPSSMFSNYSQPLNFYSVVVSDDYLAGYNNAKNTFDGFGPFLYASYGFTNGRITNQFNFIEGLTGRVASPDFIGYGGGVILSDSLWTRVDEYENENEIETTLVFTFDTPIPVSKYTNFAFNNNFQFGNSAIFYFNDGTTFTFSYDDGLGNFIDLSSYTTKFISRIRLTYASTIGDYGQGLGIASSPSYLDSYNNGFIDGKDFGYNNGYSNGYRDGNNFGYNKGYNEGLDNGSNFSFLSLFGAVLDAPINALEGLLNFEVFGVNLLTLFTGLLTLAIILLVLKLMRGGK